MLQIATNWLPGWALWKIWNESPRHRYPEECAWMRRIGAQLGPWAFPDYQGMSVPKIHKRGTSGNLARRIRGHNQERCIVTPQGGNKQKLGRDDFVIVHYVDWVRRIVYYSSLGNRRPSSDSLLVVRAFLMSAFDAWVHTHYALPDNLAMGVVQMEYPTTVETEWRKLDEVMKPLQGPCGFINMLDHDGPRHKEKTGVLDASIILGTNAGELFAMLIELMSSMTTLSV